MATAGVAAAAAGALQEQAGIISVPANLPESLIPASTSLPVIGNGMETVPLLPKQTLKNSPSLPLTLGKKKRSSFRKGSSTKGPAAADLDKMVSFDSTIPDPDLDIAAPILNLTGGDDQKGKKRCACCCTPFRGICCCCKPFSGLGKKLKEMLKLLKVKQITSGAVKPKKKLSQTLMGIFRPKDA